MVRSVCWTPQRNGTTPMKRILLWQTFITQSQPPSVNAIFIDILYSSNNDSEYRRTVNMGPIDFVSQLGGLFGLCLGFSLISFIEIFYWFSIRLFRNCVTQRSRKDSELSKIEAEFRKMKAKEFADNSFNVLFSGHASISSVTENNYKN